MLIIIGIPTLVYAQTSPEISVWGAHDHRVVGQKLTLFCKVSNLEGYVYDVKWTKVFTLTEGTHVEYPDSGRVSVSKWTTESGDEVYVLVIASITRDYDGSFTCQVVYTDTDDIKRSVSESISVRVTRNRNEILPSCYLNQSTKNTRYVELRAGTDMYIMCTAETVHEDATLHWAKMTVYEASREGLEGNIKVGDTSITNTVEFILDSSHDGSIFICTLSPEGTGDKRDCTIGPIKVIPSSTTPSSGKPILPTTTNSQLRTTVTVSAQTEIVTEASDNPSTPVSGSGLRTRTTVNIPEISEVATVQLTEVTNNGRTNRLETVTPDLESPPTAISLSTLSLFDTSTADKDLITTKNYNIFSSSSTITTSSTSQKSSFSPSHAKLTSSTIMESQKQTTSLSLSKTMTTQQNYITTQSPVTKPGTPQVVKGSSTHAPRTTIFENTKITSSENGLIKTTKSERNANGLQAGLDSIVFSAIIFSCIGFLVILFIIVICIAFCVEPTKDSNKNAKDEIPSFHMVNMEKPPSYHSRASSASYRDTKLLIEFADTKLTEPYHVTNILTNLKKILKYCMIVVVLTYLE